MPYLQSNEDANENPLFNQALLFGAAITAAGSFGSMAYKDGKKILGSTKNFIGDLFSDTSEKKISSGIDVLGKLYGNDALTNVDRNTIAHDAIGTAIKDINGPQYNLMNTRRGPQVKRTNGSIIDRIKENTFKKNDDLNNLNKTIQELTGSEYGKTRLDIYNDLMEHGRKINIDSQEAINMAKELHGQENNIENIVNNGYQSKSGIIFSDPHKNINEQELNIIDDIWGVNKSKNANTDKSVPRSMTVDESTMKFDEPIIAEKVSNSENPLIKSTTANSAKTVSDPSKETKNLSRMDLVNKNKNSVLINPNKELEARAKNTPLIEQGRKRYSNNNVIPAKNYINDLDKKYKSQNILKDPIKAKIKNNNLTLNNLVSEISSQPRDVNKLLLNKNEINRVPTHKYTGTIEKAINSKAVVKGIPNATKRNSVKKGITKVVKNLK